MKTRLLVLTLLLGVAMVGGCQTCPSAKTVAGEAEAAPCPVCGTEMHEDDFCPKCNAVATNLGEFKCPKCEKTVKAGTYCAKHNKFRFPASAGKCPKCDKVKGTWCEKCGHYAMLPHITYDENAKEPVCNK